MNAEYALLLAGCLVVTLPLDLVWKLRVYARAATLVRVIAPIAAVFVVWDSVVAGRWWTWNPRFVFAPRVLDLPLEELAFFVVVPIASILTWEVVHRTLDRDRWR